ncbi:MAG: hypothetical protein AAF927_00515 [Bacteroidota bacterium]
MSFRFTASQNACPSSCFGGAQHDSGLFSGWGARSLGVIPLVEGPLFILSASQNAWHYNYKIYSSP